MTPVDYILVGQGLAGSALAWELLRRDKRVMIFDEPSKNRASRISAGICNPITGRVMAKTFMAESLFPFLNLFYPEAEKTLGLRFFFPSPVYRPFASPDEAHQWKIKTDSGALQKFIDSVQAEPWLSKSLHNPYGGLLIGQSGYLDVRAWISAIQAALRARQAYREEHFMESELAAGEKMQYRDLTASKVIFCNGLSANSSSWFNWLPIIPLKGETVTVRMKFDTSRIVNRGVYIVPGKADQFVVGSNYVHPPFEEGPSDSALTQITSRLRELVLEPFEVIHQDWGIRPTVSDRRPLLGHHPSNRNVIIFNGLGTKGVSLAPYFARCLADWMEDRTELPKEVNIYRFKTLYSR